MSHRPELRQLSHHASGNARGCHGRLVTCEHETPRMTRTECDRTIVLVADGYEGNPLNSPSDAVCRSDGLI